MNLSHEQLRIVHNPSEIDLPPNSINETAIERRQRIGRLVSGHLENHSKSSVLIFSENLYPDYFTLLPREENSDMKIGIGYESKYNPGHNRSKCRIQIHSSFFVGQIDSEQFKGMIQKLVKSLKYSGPDVGDACEVEIIIYDEEEEEPPFLPDDTPPYLNAILHPHLIDNDDSTLFENIDFSGHIRFDYFTSEIRGKYLSPESALQIIYEDIDENIEVLDKLSHFLDFVSILIVDFWATQPRAIISHNSITSSLDLVHRILQYNSMDTESEHPYLDQIPRNFLICSSSVKDYKLPEPRKWLQKILNNFEPNKEWYKYDILSVPEPDIERLRRWRTLVSLLFQKLFFSIEELMNDESNNDYGQSIQNLSEYLENKNYLGKGWEDKDRDNDKGWVFSALFPKDNLILDSIEAFIGKNKIDIFEKFLNLDSVPEKLPRNKGKEFKFMKYVVCSGNDLYELYSFYRENYDILKVFNDVNQAIVHPEESRFLSGRSSRTWNELWSSSGPHHLIQLNFYASRIKLLYKLDQDFKFKQQRKNMLLRFFCVNFKENGGEEQ